MLRVALVLSKVQRHTADEPPLWVALAQVGLQPARMVLDFAADERVELRPPGRGALRGSGIHPLHRRCLQNLKCQVSLRMEVRWAGSHRFVRSTGV